MDAYLTEETSGWNRVSVGRYTALLCSEYFDTVLTLNNNGGL